MEKNGHIYLITNQINGKQYVGQTARDIWTRFEEHCKNSHHTAIGNAIQKYGHNNFTLTELEQVELSRLDEREIYWIQYYNTREKGYNRNSGGNAVRDYLHLRVVEKNLIIDSIEEFGRIANKQVGWSSQSIVKKIKEVVNTEKDFLSYHFEHVPPYTPLSDEYEIMDWVQTLQIRFAGKHIYCFELEKEFATIAECAKYLLDNNLYETSSKTPLQSVVTAIGKQLHGVTEHIYGIDNLYTFCFLPGSTKNTVKSEPFAKLKVYCPQIDKEFDSQAEAASYMLKSGLW